MGDIDYDRRRRDDHLVRSVSGVDDTVVDSGVCTAVRRTLYVGARQWGCRPALQAMGTAFGTVDVNQISRSVSRSVFLSVLVVFII